jgi:GntR family transcriptional regulator
MFEIDTQSSIPLHHQIKAAIREAIDNETIQPGDRLPSESEWSKVYGINKLVVRQALAELIQEGLLRRVQDLGVFVAGPKVVQVFPTVLGFSARMRREGHVTINRVLRQERISAPHAIARHLDIAEGAHMMQLVRLRIVDNEPFMIETSFLPLDRFPDVLGDDFAIRSLYDVISIRYGTTVFKLEQTLEPVLMTEYETRLLESAPGSPAMLMEVIAFASEDDPFEFSKAIVRGDKCKYYFRMRSLQ